MAYRRRRSYRSSSRRRPNYLWVRNTAQHSTTVTGSQYWATDLLAPLHYTENILARIPGPGPNAPTLDVQNAMIVRVYVDLYFHMNAVTPPAPPGSRMIWGICKGNWQQDAAEAVANFASAEPFDRIDPLNSANTTDWMGWGGFGLVPSGQLVVGGAFDSSWQGHRLDVKSRRVLSEPGETVIFSAGATAAGANITSEVAIVSSVLLRRRS